MARFARIDSQISRESLDSRESFSGFPNWTPFLRIALQGARNCESHVWADSRKSLARYDSFFWFSANRFTRIHSRESPGHRVAWHCKPLLSKWKWERSTCHGTDQSQDMWGGGGVGPYHVMGQTCPMTCEATGPQCHRICGGGHISRDRPVPWHVSPLKV